MSLIIIRVKSLMEDVSSELETIRSAEAIVRHEHRKIVEEELFRRCKEIGKLMLQGLTASGAAITSLSFTSYCHLSDHYRQ